ncbi:Conserved_hypothetical protein [Hexamita inflata]|uniref:Uncharacterized protein n=1 Tax=Hexamita inflata TaxID=28002 RepID=A0AA86PX09_9EUKA|nr:Conserved hypothetical protein [Hexamita inflata]
MSEQKCYLVSKLEDLRSKEIEKYVNVSIVNLYFKKLDHIPVHIQILKINSCSLQSLKNLCNLVNLKHLDIRDNLVNDVTEIVIHQELTYVDITNNCVILIDPVAALKKLKTLLIGNNKIVNLEPLVHHENFDPTWVAPAQQPIEKEDVAQTLTPGSSEQKIAELIKAESKKKEYSDYLQNTITLAAPFVKNNVLILSNQTSITSLLFSDCLHIDTLSLNNCPNVSFEKLPTKIKHLSITNSRLTRLNGLEKMTQLESVDLSGNNLTKCELLAQLKQLKSINLMNNKIIDLKHIKQFIQFQNVLVSEQVKPGTSDFKKYLGQEGTDSQVQQLVAEMEENAVSNEEIIHDTEMLQKYKGKVVNGVLEINQDQNLTSTEFSALIGHVNQKKVTELRIISCYNLKLDRCPKSSVKSLTINKCNLKDINGIQVMTQLTQLNLSLNQISDIRLLASLTNLTALDLGQNNIECASVISNFKQLISLDLSENLITDLSNLRDLVKLQILDVSYNNLKSINDLAALQNIEQLNITQTNTCSIDILAKMTKMTHLLMSSNQIISIAVLKAFPELYDLRLENNFIQDFEPIAKHKFANKNWVREQRVPTETDFMNSFGCNQNEVTQLINKSKQQKQMSDNKYMLIKKYENDVKNSCLKINGEQKLNNLQFTDVLKLTELEAVNSQTIDFAEDQVPTLLLKLKFNNCVFKNTNQGLNQITGIYQMEQLVELDLSSNKLRDITEIGALKNLQKLYLQNNQISRVIALQELIHLDLLNLQNNKIIFSAPLRNLKSELKLENNLIMDDKIQNKEKNQKRPEQIDYQNFLGPNSTSEQIQELQTITDYNAEMKLKYQNAVQNESLRVENDTNVNDLGFTHELNVKIIQLKNCSNIKMPKTTVNHFKVNDGMITNYSEVRLVQIPTQIVQLSADNCNMTNLVGLELLNNLKIIQIVDNPVTSLEPILGLRQVTSLTVSNSKLNSIAGIKQMKQLVELNLGSNQIREISELGNLTNLSKLELQNNDIHRINQLRNLGKLKHVNLSNNKVIFSEPLNQLKIELQIDNNIVTDNITLKNQQKPQLINYKNFLGPNSTEYQINELSTIVPFDYNYNLQMTQKYSSVVKNSELKIENDPVLIDFGFTSEIKATNFSILNCKNVKLPPQNVKYFKTTGGALVDYSEVKLNKVPSQITALTINGCQLTNVVGIELLKDLKYLNLKDNQIVLIEPVKQLPILKQLLLDNNFIHDLNTLTIHPNYTLEWIYYQNAPTDQIIQNYLSDTLSTSNLNDFKTVLQPFKAQTDQLIIQYENELKTKYQNQIKNGVLNINDNSNVRDFKFVDQMNIQQLILNNCSNLRFAHTPTKITSLTVNSSGVSDLTGIENMKQLQTLILANNSQIRCIKPIFSLSQITSLTINNTIITSIQGIENMKQLQTLTLASNSQISCIKPIFSLSQITSVIINNTTITNIVGIENMKQLKYIDLRDNCIISCEPLKHLFNLQMLFIDNNCVQDLEFITTLPNYKLDWIYYQRTPTAADIQNYQQLSNIGAEFTKHFELKLQKTKELIKTGPEEYEQKMVQKYQNKVSGNRLKIESDNELKDFKFVEKFNITTLYIQSCPNVRFWRTPNNIMCLENVYSCGLKSVRGVEKMKQLQTLAFTSNNVVDISCLKELPNLTSLNVYENKIVDFSPVQHLINRGQVHYQKYQSRPTQQEIDDSKRLW